MTIKPCSSNKILKSFRLDTEVLNWLEVEGEKQGMGYQTFLNWFLRKSMESHMNVLERRLRRFSPRIQKAFSILLLLTTFDALAKSKCPAGEHWVDPHFRSSYTRYDGVDVSATNVKGYCRLNPKGYEHWHQRLSNQRPKIWGYRKEKSKKWTVEEVQRFYDEISLLPDRFDKFRRSRGLSNESVGDPG